MSKAERYIELVSDENGHLYDQHALRAVEIAREEMVEWLANHYRDYMHNPTGERLEAFFGMDMITDLKQAMKDE